MVNLTIQPLGMLGGSECADRGLGRKKYFDFDINLFSVNQNHFQTLTQSVFK